MKILFIGDIMGKPGRTALARLLPGLRDEYGIDCVIANVENLAHGKGVTRETLEDIRQAGVDFCTSGNHIWAKNEGHEIVAERDTMVLRPANYPPSCPGVGEKIVRVGSRNILVINLLGNVMMKEHLANPFLLLDEILKRHDAESFAAILVDFHAEATSEKNTFGMYADGRVTAVVGTHTHVPTADERLLPNGTAYITDVGMVGIKNSSIGVSYESVIGAYLTQMPGRHEIPDEGFVVFNSVLIDIDSSTGKAHSITRIQRDIDI